MKTSFLFSLDELSYRYQGSSEAALKKLSFSVEKGEFVGLIGPNLSGKTTLCYLLAGIIPQLLKGELSGSFCIKGIPYDQCALQKLTRQIGVVLPNPSYQLSGMRFTVFEELAFGLETRGFAREEILGRTEKILERLQLTDLRDQSPHALSGGQLQRLALGTVLVTEAEVLILDEPTTFLDPIGVKELFALLQELNEKGTTIIISDQRLDCLAQSAQRLLFIDEGQVLFDDEADSVSGSQELQKIEFYLERSGQSQKKPASSFAACAHQPQPETTSIRKENTTPIIRVEALEHRYLKKVLALSGVSLNVHLGESVALLGRNGSGKSTLVKHLNGILQPTAGTVLIDGQDTRKTGSSLLAALVGVAFQHPDDQLCRQTVEDELAFGPRNLKYGKERCLELVENALKMFEMTALRKKNPYDLGYSQRKLVSIASVVAMDSKVLVLDEPTAGLDLREMNLLCAVLAQLKSEQRTVIAISHNMDFVFRTMQRSVVLAEGKKIFDGETSKLVESDTFISFF